MQIDDNNLFEWAFKGIAGLLMAVLSWVAGKQVKAIEKHTEELNAHRLYVAENYIKKDVVDRIHERIDDISKDIKGLIGQVGSKK